MTSKDSGLPWLYCKSLLLVELLWSVAGWLARDATWRLHRLAKA